MRLISLSANQPSFHTVSFREDGLSLILAKQKNPEESDKGKTTNGVGKSLLVTLIHFCLGSSRNESLVKALPAWEFTLTFCLKGIVHTAARSLKHHDVVRLDTIEMTIKRYTDFLTIDTFDIPEDITHLSFRSLIKRFIRPNKAGYTTFDSVDASETPFARLLATSFLLGLDIKLVHEKYRLKKAKDKVKEFLSNLEKDTIFKSFFTGDKDVEAELLDLEDKIKRYEQDLSSFQVASDYHEIESKANDAKRRLQSKSNKIEVVKNAIDHIDSALLITPDLSLDKVAALYKEAGVLFPETVKLKLEEVTKFHLSLIANRIKRLEEERNKLQKELARITNEQKQIGEELDNYLKYLGAHSALEVFISVSKALADQKAQASKLREYKKLLESYKSETQALKAALAQEALTTEKYLQENSQLISSNNTIFRGFGKRFYLDKPSVLSVTNNDGDNQIRFDIVAKIQSDASDGINEVKIFCFDLTLLRIKYRNNINFLLHDSRLFSDIDARQATTLFKILYEQIPLNKLQYIATINEDQIEAIKKHLSAAEFEEIVTKNIILTLTDEDASAKLLGIQVDID